MDSEGFSFLLQVEGAWKRYDEESWALANLSLKMVEGELLSILGPSGCGKTTLLRLIAGLEGFDKGRVLKRGKVLGKVGFQLSPRKRKIGLVFQDYALFPHLNVEENAALGLMHFSAAEKQRRSAQVLGLVQLRGYEKRYPHELSGGQQQRVALARALAPYPDVLLLDEPFSQLDKKLRYEMSRELQHILKQEGVSALLVTHDQEEAMNFSTTLCIMRKGGVEQQGVVREVLEAPKNRFVAEFVGVSDFVPARVDKGVLHSSLGSFCPEEKLAKGSYSLLVRPHYFRPCNCGKGVEAKVVKQEFLGGHPLQVLELPKGERIRTFPFASRKSGESFKLHFDPPKWIFWPDV